MSLPSTDLSSIPGGGSSKSGIDDGLMPDLTIAAGLGEEGAGEEGGEVGEGYDPCEPGEGFEGLALVTEASDCLGVDCFFFFEVR